MCPPRRAPFALSIWLAGTAVCRAADGDAAGGSDWASLVASSPVLWCGIAVAAIVAATLLIQAAYRLRRGGINPPAFVEALSHAMGAGNYQEAWATCSRWRQAILPRMLQPALERIGQGLAPVEARLLARGLVERRQVDLLLGGAAACALAAAVFCLLASLSASHRIGAAALSPESPRALALATGDIAVLAGLAIALLVPAATLGFLLRGKAGRVLEAAREQGAQIVASLPYEEIEGLRIGADFDAGSMLGEPAAAPSKRLQVSRELTTLCPSCNGPINPTRNACPHCGQLLSWT